MSKARIVVDGSVWAGTGYRAFAGECATYNGVAGLVRNIPDGRIEIFYDGPSEKVKPLVKELRCWDILGDRRSIKRISVYPEGRRGYMPAWKDYHGFDIDYGDITQYEQEVINGREWFVLGLMTLRDEFSGMREDLRRLRTPA